VSEEHTNEQYYTPDPTCASRPAACHFSWRGQVMRFTTDAGVFSRGELDKGTKLLLDALPDLHGRVLDLGCGWGAIGVTVGKKYPDTDVTMADVNHRALALAQDNAEKNGVSLRCLESDGMAALMTEKFDTVITNPPIRAGKQVIYRMFADIASSIDTRTEALIEKGMDRLMEGRTVFVIAHRLSTVRNSNAIIVLEHGGIVERGSHDELLAQKGEYYQLYNGMFELA